MGSRTAANSDDTTRLLSALSYPLWPIALVLLLIQESKSENERDRVARHHAYNAIGFFIAALILSIPVFIISWVPFIGYLVSMAFWIVLLVFAIIFALRAYRGEQVEIPVVTAFLAQHVKNF